MFIDVKNKAELIKMLNEGEGMDARIHYNCSFCNDKQATRADKITQYTIDGFDQNDFIMLWLDCTNCGCTTKFLKTECVQGVEFLNEVDLNEILYSLNGHDVSDVLSYLQEQGRISKEITKKQAFDMVKNKLEIPWTEYIEGLLLARF